MSDLRGSIPHVAALIALALTACSGPADSNVQAEAERPAPAQAQPAPVTPPPAPPVPASETVGGDGSAIVLNALSSAEIGAAKLTGELGCSFTSPDASPLLVAMGDVASATRAQGVVKVLDSVEQVSAKGGFDAMLKGAAFAGQGKTVTIALTSGRPVGGGESPGYPATLTYDRADGARRTIDGLWTCGP